MLRSLTLAVAVAVAVVAASARDARACTCVDTSAIPFTAADLLANHAAIFEGRVVGAPEPPEPPADAGYDERLAALERKVDALEGDREVQLDVLRAWKGPVGRVVVRTAASRTACGYPFVVGRSYLVFASRGADGASWVSACGRTHPSEEADADRLLLGAPLALPATASLTPARGGCAGCAVTADADARCFALVVLFVAALRARRR